MTAHTSRAVSPSECPEVSSDASSAFAPEVPLIPEMFANLMFADGHARAVSRPEMESLCMATLVDSPDERLFFKDRDSRFILVSRGFLRDVAHGRPLEEVIGKTDFDLFSQPHAAQAFEDEQRIISSGEPMVSKIECETFTDRPDAWVSTTKGPLRDHEGNIIGIWGISRDVTAQVAAEGALAHQALHDTVTGLANRVALMDRLTQALVALERQPGRVAIMFVDLDDFKDVNDTLGHDAGDQVLVEVAARLSAVARRTDTVARLGGDEFVVLCPQVAAGEDLSLIGERIVAALREPMTVNDHELYVTGSVGAIATDDHAFDPALMLQQADRAMYGAKRNGHNRFQIYDASALSLVETSSGLAGELRRGLANRELFVAYQPLFRLEDGVVSGAEALVRWRHPQHGIIPPDRFIALAEERGMIAELDEFVLDEACRQLAVWRAAGAGWDDFTMSVNLSGRELNDPTLVGRVAAILQKHEIPPAQLCLELTETALIGELGRAEAVVEDLAALGVHLALDDFGTGYSTLVHLQQFRTDILKIDRSFVAQLTETSREHKIIAMVIAMAHALGMTVIGEGIETDGQWENLSGLACDDGQGFVFSPPVSPDEFLACRDAALQQYAQVQDRG